jgi:hypothetical protein
MVMLPTNITNPELNDPTRFLTHTDRPSLFESFGYKFTTKIVNTVDIDNNTNFLKTTECTTGTFVPQSTDFRLFNPDDPYHAIINTTDQDWMFTYGIQIRYYKVKPIEEQKYFNTLYGEAASRLYDGATLERDGRFAFLTETDPLIVWGTYNPSDPDQNLGTNSIDTNRACELMFNIVYLRNILGRDPVIGDVVIPWDVPESIYEVRKVVTGNRTLYMPRRYKMAADLIQLSK